MARARASSILRNSTWLSPVTRASAFAARPISRRMAIALVTMIVGRQPKMGGAGEVDGDHQILDDRHASETGAGSGSCAQSRAASARAAQPRDILAGEDHRRGFSAERARDAVDQCRLAGAVGADQPEALAGLDIDADIIERGEAAEAFCQRGDPQQSRALWRRRRSCLALRATAFTKQPDDALGRRHHEHHQHDAEHQHIHFRGNGDGEQLLR